MQNCSVSESDEVTLGSNAPVWIPKDIVTWCSCNREFKFMVLKHYCRACGYIFCNNCTTKRAKLKYEDDKYRRVCDGCYGQLKGKGKKSNDNQHCLVQIFHPEILNCYKNA